MSRIGILSTRSTSQLSANSLLSALRRTQLQMLRAQNEISTGKAVAKPSEAPAKAASILLLQRRLAEREQHDRNLQHASGVLDNTDNALANATDLLIETRGIASSQVGIGSNTDTRRNQATVIDAQIKSLIDMGNRKYQDVALFGGSFSPANGGNVFTDKLGGIQYVGQRSNLGTDAGLDDPLSFNSNGVDAFNALSTRVRSLIDLNPQATAATRIADINGALNGGFHGGAVVVDIDGTAVTVDLTDAANLGDVATRVNNAINGVDNTAGSLAISGSGFSLTAAAGHTIGISELGAGVAAADLGIKIAATASTVAGGDVDPRLTEYTTLASLGPAIDWAGGLRITQGSVTKVADLSTATTVQDMMSAINKLDVGLRLEVNDDANSLNLVSEISGINLSIGENGGTTAEDLGLRTFATGTLLSDFRHGAGVDNPAGDDFEIRLHDGTIVTVNLDGAASVADVIGRIQTAATANATNGGLPVVLNVGAPGAVGTDINIGLAATGNGFVIEDGTAGAQAFRVVQLGQSLAADNLGIYQNAGTGSTINGTDNSPVRVDSIFSHLMALRDALMNDDSSGITVAGGDIERDTERLAQARADVGVRAQRVTQQQERSGDMKIVEQSMVSTLQDADPTEVITRFTQLQQQMEAALSVGARNLQMSLLDFLR